MLESHNHYRVRHGASPLVMCDRLTQIAQSYAEYQAAKSIFKHSHNTMDGENIGENLYMVWVADGSVNVDGNEAVKNWYDEIDLYSFTKAKLAKETAHFTQLIWKNSKKLGVGVALSHDRREVYYVANYYPAGNIDNILFIKLNISRSKY